MSRLLLHSILVLAVADSGRIWAQTTAPRNGSRNLASADHATHTAGLKPVTAQDQRTNVKDAETTRKIRRALMGKNLSMRAKNITIVTDDGNVTLRGEVASKQELNTVTRVAHGLAKTVRNEIVVRK